MASVEQTAELVKLIEQQNKNLDQQNKHLSKQLDLFQRIWDVQEKMFGKEGFEKAEEQVTATARAFDEVARGIDELDKKQDGSLNGLIANLVKGSELAKTLSGDMGLVTTRTKQIGAGVSFIMGVRNGLTLLVSSAKSAASMLMTVADSLAQISLSIVTLPFKLFENFLHLGIRGNYELRIAMEKTRGEIGNIAKNEGRHAIEAFNTLRGSLAETGLTGMRVFGTLPQRMEWVNETVKNLGSTLSRVSGHFAEQGDRIAAYIKGLGLGAEAQKGMAEESIRSGNSMSEVGRRMTTMAYGMGDAFGINGKLISKDMGEMQRDFENFGNIATKTLSSVSVFAKKLGVEIKDLLGVVGKFDNFEDAAKGAANLSQAFGLNIDVMKMLKEQDPAARIEQMRKAFFAAGKSIENMTRQERALLAQHTGLDQKTASLVFSQKNQALSYEEIRKQSDLTEKKQLSQAEAMEALAKSIERFLLIAERRTKGFFATFAEGFDIGVRRSKPFNQAWKTVQMSLHDTYHAGRKLGRELPAMIPGINEISRGIQNMFSRERIKGTFDEISKSIKNLVTGNFSLKEFFDSMKGHFMNFFDGSGSAELMEGGKKLFSMLKNLFRQGMDYAVEGLKSGFTFIADWIQYGSMPNISGGTGIIGEWISNNIIQPIIKYLNSDAFQAMLAAGKRMFSLLWDSIWTWTKDFVSAHMYKALYVVGGILALGVANTVATFLIAGAIKGAFIATGRVLSGGLVKAIGAFMGATSKAAATGPAVGGAAATTKATSAMTAAAGEAGATANASAKVVNNRSMLKIAGFIAIGLVAVVGAIGLTIMAIRKNNVTIREALTTATLVGTAALITIAAGKLGTAASVASKTMNPASLATAAGFVAVGMIPMFVAIGAMLVLIRSTKITVAELAMAVGITLVATGIVLAAIGISTAASLAATVANPALLLAGALVIGVGVVAMMASIGYVISEIRKNKFTGEEMGKALTVMGTASLIVLAAAGIAVVAGVVGAAIAATGGLAILAAAAGLWALAKVVDAAGGLARTSIEKMDGIDPDKLKKTEEVIGSARNIIVAIGRIGDVVRNAGISSVFSFGKDRGFKSIQSTIDGMADSVAEIMAKVSAMNLDDSLAVKLKMFTDTMQSVINFAAGFGEIMKNLQPGGIFTDINEKSKGASDNVKTFTRLITSVVDAITDKELGLIPRLIESAQTLSEDDLQKASAVGSILTSVGGVIESVGKASENMKSKSSWFGKQEIDTKTIRSMSVFINGIVGAMKTGVQSLLGLLNLPAFSSSGTTDGFVHFIDTIFKVVDSFSDLTEDKMNRMTTNIGYVPTFFANMNSSISSAADEAKKVNVEQLQVFASKMSEVATVAKGILDSIGPSKTVDLTSWLKIDSSKVTSFKGFTDALHGLSKMDKTVRDEAVKNAQNFGQVGQDIAPHLKGFVAAFDGIQKRSLKRAVDGVTELVKASNEMRDKIRSLATIDINSGLQAVADGLGLSSTNSLTINKGDLKINIKVNVDLSLDEFEMAMTTRPDGASFVPTPKNQWVAKEG